MAHALVVVALLLVCGCPGQHEPPGAGDPDAAVAPPDAGAPLVPGLGATVDPARGVVHFRIASERASRVEVWIYAEPIGAAERVRVELTAKGDVWAAEVGLAELSAAGVDTIYYGYRVWGASWTWDPTWAPGSGAGYVARVTGDGDRMNPNKLLIDPYARELSHDPTGQPGLDGRVYRTDEEWREVDSGPIAPKGIVLMPGAAPDLGPRPERPLRDDVVYEVHLRGLTAADTDDPCRGTYAAAGARAAALAALGVTAVELLPVQETWNDGNDSDPTSASGDNYWGYSTLAFFAPDRRYACDRTPGGPTREWQAMVRAFHQAGVKVLIDVVYNHTAEGGGGSLLSLRGLDNAAYYELDAEGTGFADQTGIGASTNAAHPLLRDLVIDSLRYWKEALGVDGFRFDLASVLGNACDRSCYRYDPGAPGNILVRAVDELPARPADGGAGVDLIAEPWGIGPGTYQLGNFPAGWSEWNDRFRDLIRQDQNQLGVVAVTPGWLANRLAGSPELFADDDRPPAASINYLVSHDGFTLHDLYACETKINAQAWPYGPSGGGNDANLSWDQTGDPARQRQAARTGLALLMLSTGVPMITGGDEMLRSQRCNNNPYNLDSPATWLDPADLVEHAAFVTFARRLIGFRHAHPALRPARWHHAASISWHGASGAVLGAAYLDDPGQHVLAWRIAGGGDDPARAIYVAYNGSAAAVAITLPAHAADTAWYRVADTGAWMEPDANSHDPGAEYRMNGSRYDLAARSLALFMER